MGSRPSVAENGDMHGAGDRRLAGPAMVARGCNGGGRRDDNPVSQHVLIAEDGERTMTELLPDEGDLRTG